MAGCIREQRHAMLTRHCNSTVTSGSGRKARMRLIPATDQPPAPLASTTASSCAISTCFAAAHAPPRSRMFEPRIAISFRRRRAGNSPVCAWREICAETTYREPLAMPIASFAAFVALLLLGYSAGEALGFGFDDVVKRARDLAASPYKVQEDKFSKELQNLTYDQYRDIRFKPDRALWRAARLPFELAFLHEGLYF